jgi:hypothetical protein
MSVQGRTIKPTGEVAGNSQKEDACGLLGPYPQRICVNRYWPVNTLETERINHTACLMFALYAYRRRQSVIFALKPGPKVQKRPYKSRKADRIQRAMRWQVLLGTNGIETKADLARYLSVSRARVTRVLKRLINHQHRTTKTADLTSK